MTLKTLFFTLALMLTACAGNPSAPVPALRTATENANRTAVVAVRELRWENAVDSWRESLAGYQAIDDWPGQGRARLGLGQAYARLGKIDLARKYLEEMPAQSLFPDIQRASAAYQLALLDVLHAERAQALLDTAWQVCGKRCPLAAQLDNLAARLAAARKDWVKVGQLAQKALEEAESLPAERAHSHRLLAEVALDAHDPHLAKIHVETALIDDRKLAEPEWLLEDYQLMAHVAVVLNDESLAQDVAVRQKSLCSAALLLACPKQSSRMP
ncbi:MAG: tetratricopeptide repeat protein [Formivibrio sp.]|nr:tetratricopeptide repeat protein [Formivibrio sp.]